MPQGRFSLADFETEQPQTTPAGAGKFRLEDFEQPEAPNFRMEVKASESPDYAKFGPMQLDLADLSKRKPQFGAQLADAFIGVLKDIGEWPLAGAKVVHAIPGVSKGVDALYGEESGFSDRMIDAADQELEPTNTAQAFGKGVAQIAEVMAPAGLLRKAGAKAVTALAPRLAGITGETAASIIPRAAVEATAAGAMAGVQGGDVTTGAVLGGTLPALGGVGKAAAPWLKKTAVDKVTQALGARKERYKAIAERISPEMLKRGLSGSRESMKANAVQMLETTGEAVDDALTQFADKKIPTDAVIQALEAAKAPFRRNTFNPATGADDIVVEFDKRPISQLGGLQNLVRQLGENAPVEHLVALRRAWDSIVAQAGGYAHRAGGAIGVPLRDQSEASAKRVGADAIRKLLAEEVPDLAAVNKEFAFWKNLDDVLTQTMQRTQPHAKSKFAAKVAAGAGAAAGMSGGPINAIGTAAGASKIAEWVDTAISSPRWAMTSATVRNKLADAMMSGDEKRVADIVSREIAVQGSKVPGWARGK